MRKRVYLEINLIISLSIFILPAIFAYVILPQVESKPVAKVGDEIITQDEFLFRYELTPQMFRDQSEGEPQLKQEFLYTLVAEKLLAKYGETTSLDTSEIVSYTLNTFRDMFVRDELYKKKIIEPAKSMADSLLGAYLDNATEVYVIYINPENQNEAEGIFKLLQSGVPFDFFLSDSILSKGDTLKVKVGQFAEQIENELMYLPENTFSKPIIIADKWYIFYSVKKINSIVQKLPGWEDDYKLLTRLAKQRAEDVFYSNYMNKIFGNFSVRANGKLLKLLTDQVYEIINMKKTNNPNAQKYFLEIPDIVNLSDKINDQTLNSTLVQLTFGRISLKDFINFFRFENISFDSLDYQQILDELNGKTRKLIEYKILVNEGYKLGLDKSPEVQKKYNMWKENYFYQLLLSEFMDSSAVSNEEIKTYYNQVNKGKLSLKKVNVIQIIVSDVESAQKILTDLENGIDFGDLAAQYSTDKKLYNNGVESGFQPISYFNEIGSAINKMKVGEIFGPMKVKEGYSIFKLLGEVDDSISASESFNSVKNDLENELRYKKMKKSLNEFIAKLARQNKIVVNIELLNSIQTMKHNSLVFELLGFGGRITAVPLISPNSEWVEEWKNSLKVIP